MLSSPYLTVSLYLSIVPKSIGRVPSKEAVSAQKALRGFETEIRDLLGGRKENGVLLDEGRGGDFYLSAPQYLVACALPWYTKVYTTLILVVYILLYVSQAGGGHIIILIWYLFFALLSFSPLHLTSPRIPLSSLPI